MRVRETNTGLTVTTLALWLRGVRGELQVLDGTLLLTFKPSRNDPPKPPPRRFAQRRRKRPLPFTFVLWVATLLVLLSQTEKPGLTWQVKLALLGFTSAWTYAVWRVKWRSVEEDKEALAARVAAAAAEAGYRDFQWRG